jgi:threonine/homoserine/homoserine lactone efflux protein
LYLDIGLQSFLIGISIAAPVGPIGILCIRRTLVKGRLAGFVSGMGAATADAFYGAIAAFGLTFISLFLIEQTFWLRLVGGIFLIYLGIRTLLASPTSRLTNDVSTDKKEGLLRDYGSTFLLTITNPLTILSFAAIFAGIGGLNSNLSEDYFTATIMVIGIFLGSSTWWLILSSLTGYFHRRIGERTMTWINRLSGAIIIGFGLLALSSLII